jgi:NAD(P)-dependent dehydrogenase (short-subunit alcohol dehydrogenase family)
MPSKTLAASFGGRVALVTGAAGGIGREIVRRLDAAGLRLVLVDIDARALEELAATLTAPVQSIVADLADIAAIRTIRATVEREVGRLDVLINNAAIATVRPPFEDCPLERIDLEYRINLIAPTLLAREFFDLLRASGDGRIVSIVSLAALVPLPESPVYSASKFGLRGAMQSIGLRYREFGIRVGSILPSSVDTAMLRDEALHGGSILNFLDPPQPASRIALEVERMLLDPRIERYPKLSDALLSQVTSLFPALAAPLGKLLHGRARAGLIRYLRERNLLAQSEHPALR